MQTKRNRTKRTNFYRRAQDPELKAAMNEGSS
jgi:hypothetical protein